MSKELHLGPFSADDGGPEEDEKNQKSSGETKDMVYGIAEDTRNGEEKQCRICHSTEREDPTKKLIRPCLCTGSVLYVHVECLNAWRATSNEASYKCSVCGYNYDVRRSYLSKIILSRRFSDILTSFLIASTDILLGAIIIYFDKHYIRLQPDVATMILSNLLDFDIWWRDPRPFMDIFVFDDGWSWTRFLKNSAVSVFVDIFMVGSTFVSLMGSAYYVYQEIKRIYLDGFGLHNHRVIALGSLVAQAIFSRRTIRIPIILGHMIVTRALFTELYEYTQQHAKHLGECILEPYRTTLHVQDGKDKKD